MFLPDNFISYASSVSLEVLTVIAINQSSIYSISTCEIDVLIMLQQLTILSICSICNLQLLNRLLSSHFCMLLSIHIWFFHLRIPPGRGFLRIFEPAFRFKMTDFSAV